MYQFCFLIVLGIELVRFYPIVSLKSNFFDMPKLSKVLKIPKICGESFFIIRMGYINYAKIITCAIVYDFQGFVEKTQANPIFHFKKC